jgi:pimeloyl-ACP methyl ester carboxylesterase
MEPNSYTLFDTDNILRLTQLGLSTRDGTSCMIKTGFAIFLESNLGSIYGKSFLFLRSAPRTLMVASLPTYAPVNRICFIFGMARIKATSPRRDGIKKTGGSLRSGLNRGAISSAVTKVVSSLPTHVYTSPSGAKGEVLRYGPRAENRARVLSGATPPTHSSETARCLHTHVFFLPGNPGIIEFYRRWIYELAERLPLDVRESTTIHALGLPGHDVRELNGERVFLIYDHCQYVQSYMQAALVSPPVAESRVIFIGHSYGAHLSLRVLNELPVLASRAGNIMLMPAVWEMGACRTRDIKLLTNETMGNFLIPVATAMTAVIPNFIRRTVVSWLGLEHGSEVVISRMMDGRRANLYNNILSLARCEVREIHDPSDEPACALLGPDRSYLYWTDDDIWCDHAGVKAIRNAFGQLTVQHAGKAPLVKHAFAQDMAQLESVARTVACWITELCRA